MKNSKKQELKPVITKTDKGLDKYLKKSLFQDKVDKANEMLRTPGLPPCMLK